MKNSVKYILQRTLGFNRYLYVFALFKIRTLHNDVKERDFFHFLSLLEDGKGDVLDIGANVGIMTVHLAKNLPNSTIHAFEPIPENVSVLRKIADKFGLKRLKIHATAVGDQEGDIKMVLPILRGARMQGLSHVKHDSIKEFNEGDEYSVPCNTLDNLINGQPIQGIKIDIENFEYFALKGGKRILEQNRPVIYAELWENENRSNCFRLLSNYSYAPHVVQNGELTPFDRNVHRQQNFIFLAN